MPERSLEGLRVVECGGMVAAPYAVKLMADLGAEVIKIEDPRWGDESRYRGPFPNHEPHFEKSGLFVYLNCNKLGVSLELRDPRGQELFRRLVAEADLLIHNVPPPQMAERGLVYEQLQAINPRLVMTSISPFGQTGPYRDYAAHDLNIVCAGAWASLNGGGPGTDYLPPLKPFGQQASFQAGLNAAVSSMGAVLAGFNGGEGQHIDVSAQECIAAMLEMGFTFWPYMGLVASRLGQRPIQPVAVMECRDGYIFVLCVEEQQWERLVEMMGNPEWAEWAVFENRLVRASNWDVLKPLMDEFLMQHTVDELYRQAQARRIPFAPVSTMADLLSSEHLRVRGFFAEITHPVAGTFRYPGAPYRLTVTPWEIRRPAPTLGQHNREVFCDRLGLSQEELAQLQEEGVV